ncbi:MAG: glycosyltransferase [Acidobacteria bacterium]|nr:glycosyltransferase [Acidobacteriota bacterium]
MTTNVYCEEKYVDCPAIRERLTELRVGTLVPDSPKVSIVIPAYNISGFVRETLDSVFAQRFTNFEAIIVNDGSPDTVELEKELEPLFDRIVYAVQDNRGASQARNSAICLARGEWLAFLDGDDIWLPEHLESQIELATREGFDMVYCDALLFGEALFDGDNFMRTSPSNGEVTTSSLISADCNVITSGTLLRKEWVERVNLFDTSLPRMQDFDLWYRIARAGARIGYSKRILIKYRVRSEGLSGSNVERSRRNIRALEVIAEKYDLNESEQRAWDEKMLEYRAEFELEKGKYFLTAGEFAEARRHIARANDYYRKPKLTVIMMLLKISPRLALQLFKRLRSDEHSFISLHR